MTGKITGRCVMPEKYDLYKSDAGAEIVFKVDEVNDGVYLSDLNAYLITLGVEDERNKYLLSKSVENNVLSLSFAVGKLVTSRSGKVTAQIVFESVGGEVIYHTMIFYVYVKNSVSGYAEPSEPLPSAITALQNSLTVTLEQCKELKADYLKQAEEYRSEKAALSAKIEKLTPNYVLIEKVITGYSVLETEPEDFTANFSSYYKTNGKARSDIDFNYVALTEAETFETGKYYSKTTEVTNLNRFGNGGKEPDGTAYAFKNLFIDIENLDTTFGVWSAIHFYVGNRALSALYYGGVGVAVNTNRSAVNADVQGNAVNAYAMAVSSEDSSTKLQFLKTKIISGTSAVLDGVRILSLPAGTTVLIYGVRI